MDKNSRKRLRKLRDLGIQKEDRRRVIEHTEGLCNMITAYFVDAKIVLLKQEGSRGDDAYGAIRQTIISSNSGEIPGLLDYTGFHDH